MQNRELAIRSEVCTAAEILRQMWVTTPRLCHLEGRIGVITPGAFGDLVVSRVDPLADLAAFADHESAVTHVLQSGLPVVQR